MSQESSEAKRGILKQMRAERRWLPVKADVVGLLVFWMTGFGLYQFLRTFGVSPNVEEGPGPATIMDFLLLVAALLLILGGLFVVLRMERQAGRKGRPATALGMSVSFVFGMAFMVSLPIVFFFASAESTREFANLPVADISDERILSAYNSGQIDEAAYRQLCQEVTDLHYRYRLELPECPDPRSPGKLLSIEPSDESKKLRAYYLAELADAKSMNLTALLHAIALVLLVLVGAWQIRAGWRAGDFRW